MTVLILVLSLLGFSISILLSGHLILSLIKRVKINQLRLILTLIFIPCLLVLSVVGGTSLLTTESLDNTLNFTVEHGEDIELEITKKDRQGKQVVRIISANGEEIHVFRNIEAMLEKKDVIVFRDEEDIITKIEFKYEGQVEIRSKGLES